MSANQKLKMSAVQTVVEIITAAVLIAFIVTFFVLYSKAGEIIRIAPKEGTYGNIYSYKKSSLLVLLIVCLAVYAVISYMQFFTKMWDTQQSQASAAENLKLMISVTKTLFVAILFYIAVAPLLGNTVKSWILITAVAIAACEIAFFLFSYFRASKRGDAQD